MNKLQQLIERKKEEVPQTNGDVVLMGDIPMSAYKAWENFQAACAQKGLDEHQILIALGVPLDATSAEEIRPFNVRFRPHHQRMFDELKAACLETDVTQQFINLLVLNLYLEWQRNGKGRFSPSWIRLNQDTP